MQFHYILGWHLISANFNAVGQVFSLLIIHHNAQLEKTIYKRIRINSSEEESEGEFRRRADKAKLV